MVTATFFKNEFFFLPLYEQKKARPKGRSVGDDS